MKLALKIPAIAAGVLLAATLAASSVQAGCGIQITFNNTLNRPVTVDKEQSRVRLMGGGGTAMVPIGTWAKFMDADVTVPAGKKRVHKTSLKQGCSAGGRQFKFLIAAGNDIIRREKFVAIQFDRKFKVKIK
jgi:hypothetical protein